MTMVRTAGTLGAFLLVLCAARAASADATPPEVQRALEGAVAIPGARVVPLAYKPSMPRNCEALSATVPRPIEGSGRVSVKLAGDRCSGWAWVRVELWAPVSVTTRAVREGQPLAGAVATVEKEIGIGRAPIVVPADAIASRALARGQMIEASHVQAAATPVAGGKVKVAVQAGALVVEVDGRSVSCGRGRACAVLASGKHVEGRIVDGRLLVEVP